MTPRLQNSYRLLHPLGEGGMGHVWLAEARILGRTRHYALKFIQPEHANDPRYTERFTKEALIGLDASVCHPNLVTTRDAGIWSNGQPYMVMDYVPGPALEEVLAALAGDIPRIRTVIGDVLCALDHLSTLGLVHRDLSPANILLAPDGYVKVADFGLAKRESSRPSGLAVGTPPYASPETLRGETATTASDLYSVGMILQTILRTSSRCPRDLRRLRKRMLATDPHDRGSAQTALRVLARAADRYAMATFARAHAPDTARQYLDASSVGPPRASAATVKRSHRRLGTASAAAAMGIAIGTGIHLWPSASVENPESHRATPVASSMAIESRTHAPACKSFVVVDTPDTRRQQEPSAEAADRSKTAATQSDVVRGTSDLWGLEIRGGGKR